MSRVPEWAGRYLSIPYEECDCWRLVQRVYAAEFGIEVGGVEKQSTNMKDREWVDVVKEGLGVREGDVVLFKTSAVNRHVGIVLNHDLMLHTVAGTNSCIERWKSPVWDKRWVSVYRHSSECPRT
jgi:cell wall-associated NlpC family hydrolase